MNKKNNYELGRSKGQCSYSCDASELSNPDLLQAVTASEVVTGTCAEKCAKVSVKYAEALVEELKKSIGVNFTETNTSERKYERPPGFYKPYD